MNLNQIQEALEAARSISNHHEFVIAGSLSVLGVLNQPSIDMSMSIDIDFYPLHDPGRAGEIAQVLGEGSEFHQRNGFYLDAISPDLPTLPNGWQDRMVKHELNGIATYFLDVNDTAVSKYARGAENDFRWIEAGYNSGILSIDTIAGRIRFGTDFFDLEEKNSTISRLRMHQISIDKTGQLNNGLLAFIHANQLDDSVADIDVHDGCYNGKVLWASNDFVVQSLGRGVTAIHHIQNLENLPAQEELIELKYQNGIPEILLKNLKKPDLNR